jgi:hypothetical protein
MHAAEASSALPSVEHTGGSFLLFGMSSLAILSLRGAENDRSGLRARLERRISPKNSRRKRGTPLATTRPMQLLYGLTLASIAFALASMVPALLPRRDAPALGVAHVQAAPEPSPPSLCGNIFDDSGSLCGPRHVEREDDGADEAELVKCDALTLLGIVHGEEADRALFAGVGVVKRGETIESGYALVEVHADRAVLARGDSRCELTLFRAVDESVSGESLAGEFSTLDGRVQVPRAEIRLTGPASLAHLRAVPTPRGLRIGGITPGSLPARLGLRSGDLIVQVDGRPLTPDSALELAARLDSLAHISVQIRRGDEVLTLRADIID